MERPEEPERTPEHGRPAEVGRDDRRARSGEPEPEPARRADAEEWEPEAEWRREPAADWEPDSEPAWQPERGASGAWEREPEPAWQPQHTTGAWDEEPDPEAAAESGRRARAGSGRHLLIGYAGYAEDGEEFEDGLDAPVPAGRGHRSGRRWRRPADYLVLTVLVVASLAAGLLVWWYSDARATTSQTAPAGTAAPPAPDTMPPTLAEVWRAPSDATQVPVAVGPSVVSGDGGEVDGRDPFTGQVRWRYRRDLPLCTVAPGWGYAVAAYHKDRNCSEITALDGATGRRGPQRNGDAELGTRLLFDGTHMTATGRKLIETWRSDLVRTQQYGTVPAIVNPGKQPRPGCTYGSAAVTTNRIAVIERCPEDPGDRVTVLKPDAQESDSDQPQVLSSSVVAGRGARLVAVTDDHVAVAVPNPNRLVVFDLSSGAEQLTQPLDLPAADLAGDPAGGVVSTTTGPGSVYWFTGSRMISLSAVDLRPQWMVPNALGPGTVFAGRLLLPVREGLQVLDPATGARIGTIPLDRQGYRGPVEMGSLGPVVLEQRGGTLVALR